MVGPAEPMGGGGRRGQPLLYVLLALVLVNLVATFALHQRIGALPRSGSAGTPLPPYLTRDARSALGETIRSRFNAKDWGGLYDQFDPVAQVQFTRDKLAAQFERLAPLIGRIDRAEYSHHKFLGRQEAGDAFELHYVLQVSGGTFHTGTMAITFVDRGDHPGIYAVFVNGKG